MPPRIRTLALTAHVLSSVGWIGAVVASLVLSVAGLTVADEQVVRAVYLTLEVLGRYALIPFSVASLATGLIQGLGTRWGLFQHYWVVIKLGMNLFATGILLLYVQTLGSLADLARTATAGDLGALRSPSPVLHGGGALVLLLIATVLSIYKPRGMTRYGQRRQLGRTASAGARRAARAAG